MAKLATLTPEEEKAWGFAYAHYFDDGHEDDACGQLAWRDLQAEFPRLLEFDGCEA